MNLSFLFNTRSLTDNQIEEGIENLLDLFPERITDRDAFVREIQNIRTLMNGQ